MKPQVARWFDLLNEYDYPIRHRQESNIARVEKLSRAPCDERRQVPDSEYGPDEPEELSIASDYYTVPLEDNIAVTQTPNLEMSSVKKSLQKPLRERHVAETSDVN